MTSILDAAVGAIQSRTDLTKLFRRNACMRHGIPWDETKDQDSQITVLVEKGSESTPTTQPTTTTSQASTVVDKAVSVVEKAGKAGSLVKTLAPWVLAATGGLGGLAGGWWMSQPKTTPTPTTTPSTQTTVIQEGERSLLQYLEDQGRHLPKK